MSGGGGFRGRGFGPQGHRHSGPGPNLLRGSGSRSNSGSRQCGPGNFRSDGPGSRPSGPNLNSEGQNSRFVGPPNFNSRGGGGPSRGSCPNFNTTRNPPRHQSHPSENWSHRGGSPHFTQWRGGGRPSRFNGPPRPFYRGRGQGQQYMPRFPYMQAGNFAPPFMPYSPVSEAKHVQEKPAIPHPGSEEERQQKITEAADALKRKLSAVAKEPDVWRDDDDEGHAELSQDADQDSRITNKGIPELKHDPPELNLTLGDLRDIGRVDHDRTEQTRTNAEVDENFACDENEVEILAHNPVKPMIEIDLWSDDNYGDYGEAECGNRTIEEMNSSNRIQDSLENTQCGEFSATYDFPSFNDDCTSFADDIVLNDYGQEPKSNDHNEATTNSDIPSIVGRKNDECITKNAIHSAVEAMEMDTKRTDVCDKVHEGMAIDSNADKTDTERRNITSVQPDEIRITNSADSGECNNETPESKYFSGKQCETSNEVPDKVVTENRVEEATQVRDNLDKTNINETTESQRESGRTKEINNGVKSGEEWMLLSSTSQEDNTRIPGLDSLYTDEALKESSKESKSRIKIVTAIVESKIEGNNISNLRSQIEIVGNETRESRKEVTSDNLDKTIINRLEVCGKIENRVGKESESRKDDTSRETRHATSKASIDEKKDRAFSGCCDKLTNDNVIAVKRLNTDTVRERHDQVQPKAGDNISGDSLKQKNKEENREKSKAEISRSEKGIIKKDSSKKTDSRDKTEVSTKIDTPKEKSKTEIKKSNEFSSSTEKKDDDRQTAKQIESDRKNLERRKLVRKIPECSVPLRNRSQALAISNVPVNFDPREPPPFRKNYGISFPTTRPSAVPTDFDPKQPPPMRIASQDAVKSPQIPPAFDPRLSALDRNALLSTGPAIPPAIPLAQDFGINQGYPTQTISNYPPIVSGINYVSTPMIMATNVESPANVQTICMNDHYAPILTLPNVPIAAPIALATDNSHHLPPLPIEPPPPLPPPVKSNPEMDDGLEDMQEAMEFAKQLMNMGERAEVVNQANPIDSAFFHMPTFPNLPPIELPPSLTDIPTPLDVEETSVKRQTVTNRVYKKTKSSKHESYVAQTIPEELTKNVNSSNETVEERLNVTDEIRPKVMFNLSSKTKVISKDNEWKQQQHREEVAEAAASAMTSIPGLEIGKDWKNKSPSSPVVAATSMEKNHVANGQEDCKKSKLNGNNSQIKKPEDSQSHLRSRSQSPTKARHAKIDNPSIGDSERSEILATRITKESNPKKSTEDTPESSWKSRVIGRFLKMSKNDICNMLNNTGLRKFDIAMKHLVKERRSTLSLGMRNNEEEKLKDSEVSYNREEFMDQLSAMLDPSATVDVCNLPTQFIHHLSEVLQLESMADFGAPLTPSDHVEATASTSPRQTATRQTPRLPKENANAREIDDRRQAKRGREKKSMYVSSAIDTSVTTTPPIITTIETRKASRPCEESVESKCAVKEENIVEEAQKYPTSIVHRQRRRHQRSVITGQSEISTMNGSTSQENPSSLNMADLDDIFTAGIARAKKKTVATKNDKAIGDFESDANSGHKITERYAAGAKDPSVDRVERAAVELDKIFTAGIARAKLASKKAAAAAAKAAEANDGDDDDEDDSSWRHNDEKSHLRDYRASKHRSFSRHITKYEKWSRRKAREDPDAFRNLTKEEWDAKYSENSDSTYEREYRAIVAMRERRADRSPPSYREDREGVEEERSGGVMSRLGNVVNKYSGLVEDWSDGGEQRRARNSFDNTDFSIEPYNRSSEDGSSSSSSSGSSVESSEEENAETPSVTKLLKVIKARERIGKKRSMNEEIRDEVAAEIERNRRERGRGSRKGHRPRPKKSHRRKKDKKVKVRERKKRDRKRKKRKSRRSGTEEEESSDNVYTEEEETSPALREKQQQLLTEQEIKKEQDVIIIVKDEPENEIEQPAAAKQSSRNALAIEHSKSTSVSSASLLPASTTSPSVSQTKTKAQLKQLPGLTSKNVATSKEPPKKLEIASKENPKEKTITVVATTIFKASPVVCEPPVSLHTINTTSSSSTVQNHPSTITSDEISHSSKTNSRKLDINTYKERTRLRQLRENEKIRFINENPSSLTQDLLNIPLTRKKIVEKTQAIGQNIELRRDPRLERNAELQSTQISNATIYDAMNKTVTSTTGDKTSTISTATAMAPKISTSTAKPSIINKISAPVATIAKTSEINTTTSKTPIISTTVKIPTFRTSNAKAPEISTTVAKNSAIGTATASNTSTISATTATIPSTVDTSKISVSKSQTVQHDDKNSTVSTLTVTAPKISTLTAKISRRVGTTSEIRTTTSEIATISATTVKIPTVSTSNAKTSEISTSIVENSAIITSSISTTTAKISSISTTTTATISSTVDTSKISVSESPTVQHSSTASAPAKKLIRRKSLTKVDAKSTLTEARVEAGKFAHIKSEGNKELKLREKIKKGGRQRVSSEGLETTIPSLPPQRVKKRSSITLVTNSEESELLPAKENVEGPTVKRKFDYFKKGVVSDGLPDIVPQESLPVIRKINETIEEQSELDSLSLPITELTSWPLESSISTSIADEIDSDGSPPFKGFAKEPILRKDRVLTEAEINSEIDDLDGVPLAFEAGADALPMSTVVDLNALRSTGVPLDEPISYGDEDFVEGRGEIETTLLGFSVTNDIPDDPEAVAALRNDELLAQNDDDDDERSIENFPEESRESLDILPRVTSTLSDSPAPVDFLMADVEQRETIPSPLLVTESIREENDGSVVTDLSTNGDKEKKKTENRICDDVAEVTSSHQSHNNAGNVYHEATDIDTSSLRISSAVEDKETLFETKIIKVHEQTAENASEAQEMQETTILEDKSPNDILSRNLTLETIHTPPPQPTSSSDSTDDRGKEITMEKQRDASETPESETKSKESSHHVHSKSREHGHGKSKRKSKRHHNHEEKSKKKGVITEKMVEEAVAANIVKLVAKPTSKETVMARMIEIDVEIHKLMNEKMTLYKMLESGEFPSKEESAEASSAKANCEPKPIGEIEKTTEIVPPNVLASRLVQNLDKAVLSTTAINENESAKKFDERKAETENEERKSKRKRSPHREKKNRTKDNISGETRGQRKIAEMKVHSRTRTTSDESSRNESVSMHSREKSSSSTELEDAEEKSHKRKTKFVQRRSPNRRSSKRPHEHSSKEDVREDSRECTDRSAKCMKLETRNLHEENTKSKLRKKTKDLEGKKKLSALAKPMEKNETTAKKTIGDGERGIIYTDESTWDSLDPEANQSEEQKEKKDGGTTTGLALLEESFKREIAESRKIKATEKRKGKKPTLRRILLGATALAPNEEENLKKESHVKGIDCGKVWKHVNTVIDAVAKNRIEQLYDETSSEPRDSTSGSSPIRGTTEEERVENKERETVENGTKIDERNKDESEKMLNSDESKIEDSEAVVEPEEKRTELTKISEAEDTEDHESGPVVNKTTSGSEGTQKIPEGNISTKENTTKSSEIDSPTKQTQFHVNHEVECTSKILVNIPTNERNENREETNENQTDESKLVVEPKKKIVNKMPKDSRSPSPDVPPKASKQTVNVEEKHDKIKVPKDQIIVQESFEECMDRAIKEGSRERRHGKDSESERVRSKSRHERSGKQRNVVLRDTHMKEKKPNDTEKHNSSKVEENKDETGKLSRPISATKRRQREKSTPPNRRSFRYSEDSGKNSRSKKREISSSRGASPYESEPARKKANHSRRSSSPLVQVTFNEDSSRRRRKRKRRPEISREEMMSCKVMLIDCKYTYLSPNMHPKILKKLGISKINPYTAPTHVTAIAPSPKINRVEIPSPPMLSKVDVSIKRDKHFLTLEERSLSSTERLSSPMEQFLPPKERSSSPKERSSSPKERHSSPMESLPSPKERPSSPNARSPSPKERSASPKRRSLSPNERPSSPMESPPTSKKPSSSPVEIDNRVEVDVDDDDDDEDDDHDTFDGSIQIVKLTDDNLPLTSQSEDDDEVVDAVVDVEGVGDIVQDIVGVIDDMDEMENVNVMDDVDEPAAAPDSTANDIIVTDENEDNTKDENVQEPDTTDEIEVLEEKITNTDKTIEIQELPESEPEEEDVEPRRTRYTVHKGPILDIKVLDDSFLAASEDGAIYRYSQKSNGILNIYKGHEAAVTCIYVLETGEKGWKLYSGSLDGTFRCYDITTGLQERPPADVGSPVQCMDQAWNIFFVGTKSGHISRYNIKSGSIKGDRLEFSDKSVLALKASSEGPRKVLIVASRNQPITIRDAFTGLFLRTICGYKNHTVYSLMRERNLVYCGTSSTSIPVFDFTNGEQITQYNAGVGIVCMRLYRQILFAGCYDGNIYVFDTKETKLICSIPGPGNMLLSMEIVGDEIIAGSKNRQLHSWRMPRQVRTLLSERT